MSEQSRFFKEGFFKKTEFCPKSFKVVRQGDTLCGRRVEPNEVGNLVLDVKETLRNCLEPKTTYLVETKFNGNRGILEFENTNASIFSEKNIGEKPFPKAISSLAAKYLSGQMERKPEITVRDAILDGELFLKECVIEGMRAVPEVPVQASAIKGIHTDLIENCKFSYKVFDAIRLNGKDLSDMPLMARKKVNRLLIPIPVTGRLSDYVDIKDEEGNSIETGENLFIETVEGKLLNNSQDIADEFCNATSNGHEGLVIKDPLEEYDWKGRKNPARKGWKKLKEEFTIKANVKKACLGSWNHGIKTTRHLARYKDLVLSICDDDQCSSDFIVARSGLNAEGGPIKSWEDWDKMIHYPLLKMLKHGEAIPSEGTEVRKLNKIKAAVRRKPKGMNKLKAVVGFKKMEEMMGCDPQLRQCYTDSEGDISLPKCIDLPKNKFIAEVATTEINMHKGIPRLGGPPRIIRIRDGLDRPDDADYLNKLYLQ